MILAGVVAGCRCSAQDDGPPDWGHAAITVGGAAPIAQDGVLCGDSASPEVAVQAATGPWWSLWIDAGAVWWSERASRAEAAAPGPTWTAPLPDGATLRDGVLHLDDVQLRRVGGGDPVSLTAAIRCPRRPSSPPRSALDALEAASAGPVHREGGTAWTEVSATRAGLALDGLRARLHPGEVAWIGASGPNGDTVALTVAAGAGPVDVVRWAEVGRDADDVDPAVIAAWTASWAAQFGVDLVGADDRSLTLRVPATADVDALADALAAACPATNPSAAEVAAALRSDGTDASRPGIAVCGWPNGRDVP